MKNIKIKTSWTKVDREEDGSLTESCKKYIYMDIDITGATENVAELILGKLVDTINKDCYCDRAGCIGIEENKKGELIYSDMLFFDKETGNVTQQKRGLMVLINSLKKEVIKEVLKKEQEQETEEQEKQALDKNKKQILKQWKALAEADLNSKELKEQAKEFYNLFKSVLVENKTQLNGNEYKNIINSLRAYGDTNPTKDKDIIVIELLNLNKSSIVLEPGSIEPLNMFLGNVLGWFKRYYAITEEPEQEEENTNMKSIKIKKTNRGYYTVIADTQKFGINEILFEGRNIEECKNYIKRTLIFILKAQLLKNRTQEAENTIKTLISYLNDKKQKTINNNIAKSWELFSTGAINMEITETEKGYYFVGEQAPVKFTFFIDKEGKDTRKQKNDKVVNTLTEDFVVEF